MSSSPNIIFNVGYVATQYHKGFKPEKMKTINTDDALKYYDREDACDKTSYRENDNENNVQELDEDFMQVDTNKAFNYYNYRVGSTGGFNSDGVMPITHAQELFEKYKPPIMYRMVFSFDDDFAIENNIKQKNNIQKLITKSMDKNIRALGLDPDNVEWGAYYHTNTDHPHIHCWMIEKKPTRKQHVLSKDGITKVKSNVISNLNLTIDQYISRDNIKNEIFKTLNELGLDKESNKILIKSQNNAKKFFNVDKDITNKLINLEKKIPKTGSLKFNSKNIRPFHEDILDIVNELKKKNDILPIYYKFQEQLEKEVEIQIKNYGGTFDDVKKTKFINDRNKELDDKIANLILGNIKSFREDSKDYEKEDVKNSKRNRDSSDTSAIDNSKGNKVKPRKKSGYKRRNSMATRSNNLAYALTKEISRSINEGVWAMRVAQQNLDEMQRKANEETYHHEM